MEERLVKKLLTSIKCCSCGQHYDECSVDILGHSEELWFLRMICSSCSVQSLVAAIIKEDNRPEDTTDLTREEVERFAAVKVVGADDVLDMHTFLQSFDGDFSRLLNEELA